MFEVNVRLLVENKVEAAKMNTNQLNLHIHRCGEVVSQKKVMLITILKSLSQFLECAGEG